jgi:hypothetical protein
MRHPTWIAAGLVAFAAAGEAVAQAGKAPAAQAYEPFYVGGGYDFNPQVGVRLEYESYGNVGEQNGSGRAEVSLVSGSAIVRF